MRLDPSKLASRANNGIFEGDAEGYAAYARWREGFVLALRRVVDEDAFKSSISRESVASLLARVDPDVDRERVFNAVMSDMVHNGASWLHFAALTTTAGYDNNPFPQHDGRFSLLLADWIIWHDDMLNLARNRPVERPCDGDGDDVSAAPKLPR